MSGSEEALPVVSRKIMSSDGRYSISQLKNFWPLLEYREKVSIRFTFFTIIAKKMLKGQKSSRTKRE